MRHTVVIDENLPLLPALLPKQANLICLPSAELTPSNLRELNATALFCRTVTKVDKHFLQHSNLNFIASASSGIDHFDQHALQLADITWAHAPGCNALAVAEYVLTCVAVLQHQQLLCSQPRIGIIGVGHVGQQISTLMDQLGFHVKLNDPPRADREADFISTPLEQLTDCDLLCIHSELNFSGPHPSYHLIAKEFLQQLKPGCVILNAARGAIIHSGDFLQYAQHCVACFDVWEPEPQVNVELVNRAYIATPHIAGYSLASKQRAVWQVYQAFCRYAGLKLSQHPPNLTTADLDLTDWQQKLLAAVDPRPLSDQFKTRLQTARCTADTFTQLRREYPLRPEILAN